jgi:hypothetical protein
MGVPSCSGPEGATVVVVVLAGAAAVVVVVVPWRGEVGVGDPEPQAASTNGAVSAATNPNCRR